MWKEMRGESHLTVSMLVVLPSVMILYNMLLPGDVSVIGYILGGVMIGSLLPDVDASDAKVMHGYWKPIGLVGRYLFYKPMTWLLRRKHEGFEEKHRGYLHSLIGCLLTTLFFAIVIGVIFIVLTFMLATPIEHTVLFWYLWIGIPIGFLLHLVEDSFTKSGVRWFFPRGKTYSGQTTTGRKSEYNLLTAFVITFGLFVVLVWGQPATVQLLAGTIIGSIVLLGVLYGLSPIISRHN